MKKFIAWTIWITGIVIAVLLYGAVIASACAYFYFVWSEEKLHVIGITLAALAVVTCIVMGGLKLFDWAKDTIDS